MKKALELLLLGILTCGLVPGGTAAPLSGCTLIPPAIQSCHLYQEDASGNPSAISWEVPLVFGTFHQYLVVLEPGTAFADRENPDFWNAVVRLRLNQPGPSTMQIFSDPFPGNLPAPAADIVLGFFTVIPGLGDHTQYIVEDPVTQTAEYVNPRFGDRFVFHTAVLDVAAVPAPATLLLLCAGAMGFGWARRRTG